MSQAGQTSKQAGFTLLELLVVLTISGLLLALTPPLFSSILPQYRAEGASKSLASYLLQARHEAIIEGRIVHVIISSAGYGRKDRDQTQHWPDQVTLAQLSEALIVGDQQKISLKFFADGSSSGGHVRLISGTRSASVFVNWLTGQVSRDD